MPDRIDEFIVGFDDGAGDEACFVLMRSSDQTVECIVFGDAARFLANQSALAAIAQEAKRSGCGGNSARCARCHLATALAAANKETDNA